MKIKTKLTGNVLVTAAIVVAISSASYFSMRFIQDKLSYLTEKSTPFQMRTIELQRELQGCITSLLKVNAAQNMNEFKAFQSDAEKSLEKAASTQKELQKINISSQGVSAELEKIARELFAASKERINSNNAAVTANDNVLQRMKESSARLKELETSIRNLQIKNSKAFSAALENTATFSGKLQSIEDLRNLVRELQLISQNVQNLQNSTSVLIARGKHKAISARISRNDHYKNNKIIASVVNSFSDMLSEYIRLKSVVLTKKENDSINRVAVIEKEIPDKLGALFQTLDQETVLARDELTLAANRQGSSFTESNNANDILVANSELVALGTTVKSDINKLFTVTSPAELEKSASEIRGLFDRIHERASHIENLLKSLAAKNELKMLEAAHTTLEAIRTEIYSANGIIVTLKKELNAIEEADKSSARLHALVIKQSKQGNESVSTARLEQEKAIVEVNSVIKKSLSQISGIGLVAIVIGILFGFWIFRSILLPLRLILDAVKFQQKQVSDKANLAESVAGGDLNREVTVSEMVAIDPARIKNDEMGMVLKAVVAMSEAQVTLDKAFSDMTTSLCRSRDEDTRRDRLKTGLFELNKILRGNHKTNELADRALTFVASFLKAGAGIMYLFDENDKILRTISTYAVSAADRSHRNLQYGEGLPGQVALERKMICINSVPSGYLSIGSALGEADPVNVTVMPVMHNDILVGVLELGSFRKFSNDDFDFLNQAMEGIAIAIRSQADWSASTN